jgi:hypothetical protein
VAQVSVLARQDGCSKLLPINVEAFTKKLFET